MQYVELGATKLKVSRIALGTASFALERYGIPTPGEAIVDSSSAIALTRTAAEAGVNFFDTAPSYGPSERLLGEALVGRPDCVIATKVAVPHNLQGLSPVALQHSVDASVDRSRRALRRDVLDVVQIHNATIEVLRDGRLLDCLQRVKQSGKLRHIGASVYGPATALAAIRCGQIDILQLAVSLLDQRMCSQALPEAEAAGVGILTRSALLKGALTKRAQWLPESLGSVAEASARAVTGLQTSWDELPSFALRFCFSLPGSPAVLVGVQNPEELQACLDAEKAGVLPEAPLRAARSFALQDEQMLNPSFWQLEESDIEPEPA
jgi:aryl-alcohol dehydrogenase-like predicted oxidoreductase